MVSSREVETVDQEMQSLMDRYLDRRSPVSIDDYDWNQIQPTSIEPDFLDAVAFVTLVESNPEEPARKLLEAADRSNAPWLRRFITQTWLPEESMHHAPYREYLIQSKTYTADFIDFEISKVKDRPFIIGDGNSELQAATYGWLQELITWRFYESMQSYLIKNNQSDPILIKILSDIGKQENFHRHIYLTGVRTVLKHSPHRKKEVVEAVSKFLMPGHEMVPEWQPRAPGWGRKFGFSLRLLGYDIANELLKLVGYSNLGKGAVIYATKNKMPWWLKIPVTLSAPLAKLSPSPVNYLAGKLICKVVLQSKSNPQVE